jgi:hypothetical protein
MLMFFGLKPQLNQIEAGLNRPALGGGFLRFLGGKVRVQHCWGSVGANPKFHAHKDKGLDLLAGVFKAGELLELFFGQTKRLVHFANLSKTSSNNLFCVFIFQRARVTWSPRH